jgi:hypothetical protein
VNSSDTDTSLRPGPTAGGRRRSDRAIRDAVVGAWTTYAAGTLEDAANGLHIGVMSNGKFTPLRFTPGFDRAA